MVLRSSFFATFVAAYVAAFPAQEPQSIPRASYVNVSQKRFDAWMKGLKNPRTQRLSVGTRRFTVVGDNLRTDLPVMSVYVFEYTRFGYWLRLTAQGQTAGHLRLTHLTKPDRLRVEGLSIREVSIGAYYSKTVHPRLIADLGL